MYNTEQSSRRALLVLLLGAFALVLFVFRSLGQALFLAGVLSMVLWPLHQRLTRGLRGHGNVAAGFLVIFVVLAILGPLVGMSAFVVNEAIDATRYITETIQSEGVRGLVAKLPDSIEGLLKRLFGRIPNAQTISEAVQSQVGGAGPGAALAVGAAVSATGSFIFQSVMMLLALFFFLTNKESIINWVDEISPLRRGQTRELLAEFVRVCKSVIVSSGVTSLVQAAAALIGYYIAKVPHPVFFGVLTFFIAFIPAVGAASVCFLAAGLLLVTGHPMAALFLAIWGMVVVGLVDNVVKPILIKHGMQMHGAIVFFALLGGLGAFGAVGLVIGPLAVALFLALLRMYQRDYAADPRDRQAMRQKQVGSPAVVAETVGHGPDTKPGVERGPKGEEPPATHPPDEGRLHS